MIMILAEGYDNNRHGHLVNVLNRNVLSWKYIVDGLAGLTEHMESDPKYINQYAYYCSGFDCKDIPVAVKVISAEFPDISIGVMCRGSLLLILPGNCNRISMLPTEGMVEILVGDLVSREKSWITKEVQEKQESFDENVDEGCLYRMAI